MASLRRALPLATRNARPGGRSLRSSPQPQILRVLQRRGYADHADHGHAKGFGSGPDWPWAVGSVIVTGLGSWWLLSNDPMRNVDTSAHDHGHSDSHGEAQESNEGEDKEASGDQEEGEGDDQSKSDDAGGESDSGSESGKDTPASSDDESAGEKRSGGSGSDEQEVKDEDGVRKSKGPAYDVRTGAKHRSDPHGDKEKSQKAEGVVETAKIKGVIDSKNRPAK